MNTQPGIQTSFPWQEGPVPLQPIDNQPEPLVSMLESGLFGFSLAGECGE